MQISTVYYGKAEGKEHKDENLKSSGDAPRRPRSIYHKSNITSEYIFRVGIHMTFISRYLCQIKEIQYLKYQRAKSTKIFSTSTIADISVDIFVSSV